MTAAANAATDATPARPHQSALISNVGWHYCWSHGLGQSPGVTLALIAPLDTEKMPLSAT